MHNNITYNEYMSDIHFVFTPVQAGGRTFAGWLGCVQRISTLSTTVSPCAVTSISASNVCEPVTQNRHQDSGYFPTTSIQADSFVGGCLLTSFMTSSVSKSYPESAINAPHFCMKIKGLRNNKLNLSVRFFCRKAGSMHIN